MSILEEILAEKKQEVSVRKQTLPVADLAARDRFVPRGFVRLFLEKSAPRIIAEIKKASPSKGVICADFDAVAIANRYLADGAAALSILTDEKFFQGDIEYLSSVREVVSELPILRKDFIIDPYQLTEAKAYGADAILLIVSALEQSQLEELYSAAIAESLDVIVEVHSASEMEAALTLAPDGARTIIGINNRDLNTFDVTLDTTINILQRFESELNKLGLAVVSESGIFTKEDIQLLTDSKASGFLIGESIIKDKELLNKLLS